MAFTWGGALTGPVLDGEAFPRRADIADKHAVWALPGGASIEPAGIHGGAARAPAFVRLRELCFFSNSSPEIFTIRSIRRRDSRA
jgi:hypothetical protein